MASKTQEEKIQKLQNAWLTVKALRDPDKGCPWDKEQTHQSLLRYLIEEAYEYCQAVSSNNIQNMKDELGDVLFQVLLHSTIAEERGHFTLADVAFNLEQKLIKRHPHVFANNEKISSQEVVKRWEEIKHQEKLGKPVSLLGDSWTSAPGLLAAFKIGEKTKKINFDWDDHSQVVYKVEEEWQELKEELTTKNFNRDRVREELGDLLFTLAQLARHLDIEPELALNNANHKFAKRFALMQKAIEDDGKNLHNMNQQEMDFYWNKIKRL